MDIKDLYYRGQCTAQGYTHIQLHARGSTITIYMHAVSCLQVSKLRIYTDRQTDKETNQ